MPIPKEVTFYLKSQFVYKNVYYNLQFFKIESWDLIARKPTEIKTADFQKRITRLCEFHEDVVL